MDFDLAQRGTVEGMQRAMQMAAKFVVNARNELRDFLLGNRGSQVDIPCGQAGKGF